MIFWEQNVIFRRWLSEEEGIGYWVHLVEWHDEEMEES